MIIASTSFFGAYLIVRPLGWFFGGFPSELRIVEEAAHEDQQDQAMLVCYFVCIVVLAVVGINFQAYQWKKGVRGHYDTVGEEEATPK